MIKKNIGRILAFLFIVFLAFGIGTTYERYRGTDLSRVPVVKRVPTQRLKQARYRQETTEGASTTSGTEDTNTRLTSVDSNGKPLLAENEMLSSAISTESLGGTTDELLLYPSITKGMRTPFDLWRYYGRGRSSFGSPILPMRFDQWLNYHRKQKPKLMRDQ